MQPIIWLHFKEGEKLKKVKTISYQKEDAPLLFLIKSV
jgi:hypothetical protein